MDFSSFLTSLGTSCIIFVVLMLLFTWLSRKPGNVFIYYPNRILRGLDPWENSSVTRNPLAWAKEALTSSENDVINMAGVDTAVYFVFLSTVLGILSMAGIILLPLLLPIAATDDNVNHSTTTSNGTFSDLDKLSLGNVRIDDLKHSAEDMRMAYLEKWAMDPHNKHIKKIDKALRTMSKRKKTVAKI